MKNEKKYLNILIKGETSNIGVLDIGVVHITKKPTLTIEHDFKMLIETKMVEALQSHFDCPVRVIMVEATDLVLLTLEATVIICSESEDYQETVTLNETWVY